MRASTALLAAALLSACATLPTAPQVMVLPGSGKSLGDFQTDDGVCRAWAARQSGAAPSRAERESTATGAAAGTALGAAGGAAIGAASGAAASGAAVGSGLGLLGGTLVGAGRGAEAGWSAQDRYDVAYMQCMYAKGNQIPVPRGSQMTDSAAAPSPPPGVPPPPRGSPPPPPPGASR